MKVSVEKLPTSEAVLDVEISWDEMEKASEKAYRKLVQKLDVHGFRRGKAPRSIVERKVGKEYIYQEGLDELISETYRTALKDHELIPIKQPKLDAPVFEIGQPYHLSVTVPIITPVVLGDYRSLHFDREEAEITPEEVEKELTALRNSQVKWQLVERPVAEGDRVTIDLKLTAEDKSISDLKGHTFEITKDRPGLFIGMDDHLLGMQPSESKSFSTTVAADYTNEKLAGKEANYEVMLHTVEEKELPELDDSFAEKVSGGRCHTVEDLRQDITNNVLENKKRHIREVLRDNVLNGVVEQAQITLHPLLIDDEAEEMVQQLARAVEQQGISVEQYLRIKGKTREEYLEEIRPDAEKRIKRQLVLEALARQETIEVVPEEIEKLFRVYAQVGQKLPRTEGQIRALAAGYLREKAMARLMELTIDPDPNVEVGEAVAEEASKELSEDATSPATEVTGEV